jgi:predicted phosphodiesterase
VKRPDAILTADWHVREDQPACRLDDFWKTQLNKISWVDKLQREFDCPVIHPGDLSHYWKMSPFLLLQLMLRIPAKFWTNIGNHDLPQQALRLYIKSGMAALEQGAKCLRVVEHGHWGEYSWPDNPPPEEAGFVLPGTKRRMLVWHIMTWSGKKSWPGCKDPRAEELLEGLPFDIIVTGHNHKPFVVRKGGKLLVNPGSITRQKADHANYSPRVYLYYAKDNEVVARRVPFTQGVISNDHITLQAERDQRLEAFITRLRDDWDAGISFEENLERFERQNHIRGGDMEIVRRAIER